MTLPSSSIIRGDIWEIDFDPSRGSEIRKIRPSVVLNIAGVGRMPLRIVVPITGWQLHFSNYIWLVHLIPTATNGLTKDSAADAFQVKSVSETRFRNKLGTLSEAQLIDVAAAVALCIGFVKPTTV